MMAAPVSFTFSPNKGGQDRLLHSTTGPYAQWLTRLGNRVVTSAKGRANVATGLMRSRIEFRLIAGPTLVGEVVAGTNYSRWVHDGTRYYSGNPFLTDALREVLGSV